MTVVVVAPTVVLQGFDVASPKMERGPLAILRVLVEAPPLRPPVTLISSVLISISDSMSWAVILAEKA